MIPLPPAIDLKRLGQAVRLVHGDLEKIYCFQTTPAAQALLLLMPVVLGSSCWT